MLIAFVDFENMTSIDVIIQRSQEARITLIIFCHWQDFMNIFIPCN